MKSIFYIIFFFTYLTIHSSASNIKAYFENQKGIESFNKQEYDLALSHYAKALEKNGEEGKLLFNIGNSYLKNNQTTEAQNAYLSALKKLPLENQAKAHHNLANSYFNAQKYKEAISHYIDALKLNPNNTNSQKDLELALSYLKQQQQQPEQNQQNEDKNQENDNKKDQNNDNKQNQSPQDPPSNEQKEEDKTKHIKNFLNNLDDHEKEAMKQYKKQTTIKTETDYDW